MSANTLTPRVAILETKVDNIDKFVEGNGQLGAKRRLAGVEEDVKQLRTNDQELQACIDDIKTEIEKVYNVVIAFTQRSPESKERSSDKVTNKWLLDKVVSAIIQWTPWGIMIAVLIKYFTLKP